jgi:3-oxoacyl-[acyl-carrier protein] reductase
MELGLKGRRAAVGGSSQGLGFAIARALAAEGCRVAIAGRDRDRIDAAASVIRAETDAEVLATTVDFAQPGATTAWIDEVAGGWGGLDLVVPNSGGPLTGRFGDSRPEDWDAAYRLTLRSALEAAAAARPHLGRGAAMLFMTGPVVRQPHPMLAIAGVMRSGVSYLAKALSDEWAAEGIRVNHIIPGRIATERVAEIEEETARRLGGTAAEARAAQQTAIPLHRYGSVGEFAAAAVFLLSDAASYITGATLSVDGGMVRAVT